MQSPPPRIGHLAPNFELPVVDFTHQTSRWVSRDDFRGKWLILIFYPRDFSFVCPTELTAFSARAGEFQQRQCELLGISVDSLESHQQWLQASPDDGGLGPLQFPLGSDPEGHVAQAYGVWVPEKRVATRGMFMIDPEGVLQYSVVHNLSVGRGTDEVLRVLDALRTGGLCPSSWTRADGTIDVEGALQKGRVLSHFRIHQHLGNGSFGTVFSAWDLRLQRMAAIKVLKRSDCREALLAEARSAAALNHPHVCTIYAVEEEDGLPIVAMEYLEGKPLSELISQGLPPRVVREFARQIASGIATAHEHGIVHGDLKPANIMVTTDNQAKILDFGLARSLRVATRSKQRQAAAAAVTEIPVPEIPVPPVPGPLVPVPLVPVRGVPVDARRTAAEPVSANVDSTILVVPGDPEELPSYRIAGTPAYMAPEQLHGEPSTPASDVFAWGLILYEMLTRQRALDEPTLAGLLSRSEDAELAERLAGRLDPAFGRLALQALAPNPSDRPAMRDLATQT